MHNKKKLPLLIFFSLPTIGLPMILSSCSSSGIVIANFESYMSNDVVDGLKHDHDIKSSLNFLYYATNEDIETKFNKYYDIAIPSSYEAISLLQKNQLARIDWTQFKDNDGNRLKQIDQSSGSLTASLIANGKDAETLFSATAKEIIEQANQYINRLNLPLEIWNPSENGKNSILDYAIPYFLQDLVFAYKNSAINGLTQNFDDTNYQRDSFSYNDILNVVAPHGNKHSAFFNPSKTKKIGMVEDSRTVFDFSKLISTEQTSNPDINPTNEQSINDYKNTYSALTSKFDKQYFWLNSDSGQISIALASPLNDGGLNSAFTYNGDILYAAMGSDLNAGIDPSSSKYIQYFDDKDDDPNCLHMHFIRPSYVPAMMDMMVINKNSTKSQNKKQDLYKIVNKICLDSSNEVNDNNFDNDVSFQNWSYILYTNPLFLADKYIKEQYFTSDNFANWHLLKNIYSMNENDGANKIENPINDMAKSNMYWAFINEREKL